MRLVMLCALGIGMCAPALAQINKCVDERGRVSYQEQPCPGAKPPVKVFSAPPAEAESAPPQAQGDPASRAREAEDMRRNCPQARAQIAEARKVMETLPPGQQGPMRAAVEEQEAKLRRECPS